MGGVATTLELVTDVPGAYVTTGTESLDPPAEVVPGAYVKTGALVVEVVATDDTEAGGGVYALGLVAPEATDVALLTGLSIALVDATGVATDVAEV